MEIPQICLIGHWIIQNTGLDDLISALRYSSIIFLHIDWTQNKNAFSGSACCCQSKPIISKEGSPYPCGYLQTALMASRLTILISISNCEILITE